MPKKTYLHEEEASLSSEDDVPMLSSSSSETETDPKPTKESKFEDIIKDVTMKVISKKSRELEDEELEDQCEQRYKDGVKKGRDIERKLVVEYLRSKSGWAFANHHEEAANCFRDLADEIEKQSHII